MRTSDRAGPLGSVWARVPTDTHVHIPHTHTGRGGQAEKGQTVKRSLFSLQLGSSTKSKCPAPAEQELCYYHMISLSTCIFKIYFSAAIHHHFKWVFPFPRFFFFSLVRLHESTSPHFHKYTSGNQLREERLNSISAGSTALGA